MLPNKQAGPARLLLVLLVILLVALPLAGCAKKDKSDVVATYDKGEVSANELNGYVGSAVFFSSNPMLIYYVSDPSFQEHMLRQMIATRLLTENVDSAKRKESAKQAKKDIDEMNKSINSDANSKAQFNEMMTQLGIKLDDLRNYMEMRYNYIEYFTNKFSEADLEKEYNDKIAADKNAYITTATVRHVLVATKNQDGTDLRTKEEALKRAQEAFAKLNSGGDWTAVAKEYSDDDGSKELGGLYADQEISQWVPEFADHAIHQALNELGEPFETQFGYHVMVVEKRNPNDFASVKEDVRNDLSIDFFSKFMEEELDKQHTKITLPKEDTTDTSGDATNAGGDTSTDGNATK